MTETQAGPAQAVLVTPSLDLRAAFEDMAEDYRAAGEGPVDNLFSMLSHDFAAYVERLEREGYIRDNRGARVPATTYWLYQPAEDALIGTSRLRHELTPGLTHEGGHIGYSIRPSARRQGYGTRILELTLDKAREHGIFEVLITCDTDNAGSARIIEKNGGVFENEVLSERTGKPVSRYWITLDQPGGMA